MLRTCADDMTSRNGFVWPESGPVEAPDWYPAPECGHGLHGFLWGEGDGANASWASDAKWLVVEVDAAEVVDLGGKIKVPRGVVVFCGDRYAATAYLAANGAHGRAIIGGQATAGDGGTVCVWRWDGSRMRLVIGYPGEDGILPNVAYKCDPSGKLVRADGAV